MLYGCVVGTSEGAKKGWTEERRARQSATLRLARAAPEWRAAQSARTKAQWDANPDRRRTQGAKVAAKLTRPAMERFRAAVDYTSSPEGCHLWRLVRVHGYAKFALTPKKQVSAVRWLWEELRAPIPPGYGPDHLCHTNSDTCAGGSICPHRGCVNLDHIELVTHGDNLRRMHARKRRLKGVI